MSYWQNKVAIVTGGSSGLGLAIAKGLHSAGATVVLAARDANRLEAATSEVRAAATALATGSVKESGIEQRGPVGFPCDITRDEQVASLIGSTLDRFGRLDVLVNCAGKSGRGKVLDTTPQQFQEMWELNFLALVRCTRAAAPHLLKSRGHLVNIGSLASKSASKYLGAYPATKFAVAAYTQQLRLELEPEGLHVLLVCPGPIKRDESTVRYAEETQGLPESARKPGGGVKLKGIDPQRLAKKILTACEHRKKELVVPCKSKILFAMSQLSPSLGDWVVNRMTGP
ncbi:MAG: SDR family NAD(P)-dependent oxidoreductase [Planctomycetales bacterium]|nr:SDR family NAD(P)-dependent oxidoreductase [Planctomycetales bacterium]